MIDDVTDVRCFRIQIMMLGPGLDMEVSRNSVTMKEEYYIERGVLLILRS